MFIAPLRHVAGGGGGGGIILIPGGIIWCMPGGGGGGPLIIIPPAPTPPTGGIPGGIIEPPIWAGGGGGGMPPGAAPAGVLFATWPGAAANKVWGLWFNLPDPEFFAAKSLGKGQHSQKNTSSSNCVIKHCFPPFCWSPVPFSSRVFLECVRDCNGPIAQVLAIHGFNRWKRNTASVSMSFSVVAQRKALLT